MNRQEKEKLVLELYRQGKTIREIAKIVHMSFGEKQGKMKSRTESECQRLHKR